MKKVFWVLWVAITVIAVLYGLARVIVIFGDLKGCAILISGVGGIVGWFCLGKYLSETQKERIP